MAQESAGTDGARVLVDLLRKTVRAVQLYPPASWVPSESKKKLFTELTSFLEERGVMTLRVEDGALLWGGHPVRKDAGPEDPLAAALSRDGIRTISFLPDLGFDELELFLDIVRRGVSARGNDDLSTMLWEASLSRISYTAVGGTSQETSPTLERRSRKHGAQAASAGAGPDYLSIIGEEAGAARDEGAGSDVSRLLADFANLPGDLAQVEECRREALSFDYEGSTSAILLEILAVEDEASAFGETCVLIGADYDRLVSSADFVSARSIVEGLEALEAAPGARPADCAALLKDLRLRANSKARIEQLCLALNAHLDSDLGACRRLLVGLPGDSVPRLFEALAILEKYQARMMVCEILVERGRERVEAVGDGLLEERWFVARNAAMVLGRIGGGRACACLARATKHAHEAVRREVVAALIRIEGPESSAALRAVLSDESRELRLRALAALSGRRDAAAGLLVEENVQADGFLQADEEEQRLWLSALARIREDAALPTFRGLIDRWILFDRSAAGRRRLLAVAALAEGSGPKTVAYLEELARGRTRAVRESAGLAVRKILAATGRSET